MELVLLLLPHLRAHNDCIRLGLHSKRKPFDGEVKLVIIGRGASNKVWLSGSLFVILACP